MLHILWMILKILGILLLVVLGIVLFVLLMALFCPIRYRLSGIKGEACEFSEASAKVRVSWLFGGIAFCLTYVKGELLPELKVFGLSLFKKERKEKKSKNKREEKPKESKNNPEEPKRKAEEPKNEPDDSKDEAGELEQSAASSQEKETQKSGGHKEKTIKKSEEKQSKKLLDEPKEQSESGEKEQKGSFFEKIRDKITGVQKKSEKVKKKTSWWKDFLTDERTKRAVSLLLREGKGLIRHVFPKKMKGNITFGFDDPSRTGEILAGLGMTYGLYKNNLQVTPVWDTEETVLYGNLSLAGRIYGIVVLVAGLKILLSKNIRFAWKKLKHKEERNGR